MSVVSTLRMSLAASSRYSDWGRLGGRPRNSDDPAKRRQQIRFVGMVLASPPILTVKQAAFAAQVDRTTIHNWITTLLNDGEVDTEGLRRIAGPRWQRRIKH